MTNTPCPTTQTSRRSNKVRHNLEHTLDTYQTDNSPNGGHLGIGNCGEILLRIASFSEIAYSISMNIFDFITQDEIEELPEDPNMAFTAFVGHASKRLSKRTAELDNVDDQESYQQLEEARHGFMNVVVAAAKRYKIEPFASMDVPTHREFDWNAHRDFKSDIDHYMTQLLLDNVVRERSNSVELTGKAKDRIRGHIHALKTCIDNADLSDAKRAALHKKLTAFEGELEKKRLNLLAVTRVTLEVLALPGGVWATSEIVHKLTTNVMEVVAEAKAAEDEARRLAPSAPPLQLSAPRKAISQSSNYDDLDDDIPF